MPKKIFQLLKTFADCCVWDEVYLVILLKLSMDRPNRLWLFVRLNFIICNLRSKYSCDVNTVRLHGGPKTRGKRLVGDVKEKKEKRKRRMGKECNPRKLN